MRNTNYSDDIDFGRMDSDVYELNEDPIYPDTNLPELTVYGGPV